MSADWLISGATAGAIALSGGGSGLLSIPDAGLIPLHSIEYQHTNGILPVDGDSRLARQARDTTRASADHIQFTAIPNLEFGARLTTWYSETTGSRQLNDLSGHLKLQVWSKELFAAGPRLRVALGARDFAGEADNFAPAEFIVADLSTRHWQLVLGGGHSDNKQASLNGAFAGAVYAPWPWLSLLADYDGVATNAGVRFTGHYKQVSLYLQAHATDFDPQDGVIATAGVQIPIGEDRRLVPRNLSHTAPSRPAEGTAIGQRDFLDHRNGADGVAAEYGAYLQQETGSCHRSQVVKAQAVPLLLLACDEFDTGLGWQTSFGHIAHGLSMQDLRPLDVRLEPSIRYAIGTEYGRLDGAAAARGSLEWHSPIGLSAYGVWDAPLGGTDDYERGQAFGRDVYEGGLFEGGIQLTLHALPGVFVQASTGNTHVRNNEVDFTRFEVATSLFRGRLGLDYSETKLDDDYLPTVDTQKIFSAFLWAWAPNYAAEFSGGTYLYGDKGKRLDLYKYIGRTRLGLYLKDGDEFQAVGMTISVSLTPDKALRTRFLSVSGTAHFTPNLETQISTGNGINNFRPSFMQAFTPQRNLVEDVLDQWRLNPHYISRR